MNLGVDLKSYAEGNNVDNVALFDQANTSADELAQLSKALEAGLITGRSTADSTTASGASLKVESLEKNLKLITFREQDIRLWKAIPKDAAFNTVEEYNQLVSYGTDRGGFNSEGELPEEEDSTYVRRSQLVKFLGVTKSVTHPMQLVRTNIGSIVQREIQNGTMWILRKVNRALAFGNATVIPQEFNGLYVQHAANDAFSTLDAYQDSDVVVDLRGTSLKQEHIEDATQGILANFGYGNLLFAPPKVLADFAKDYYQRQRILLGGNFAGTVGAPPKSVSTTAGDVQLQHDIFLKAASSRKTTDAATSSKAPGAVGVTSQAAATDTGNRFGTAFDGDYRYAVAAVNRYGESTLTSMNASALTIASTQSADLTFTDGGGAYAATGYVIYRSKINETAAVADTLFYPIFTVSVAQKAAGYDGGAATKVRDRNRFIANTEQAFLIQGDQEVYNFKQLAPLMKMDLATLSPAYRFMVLLYGTPQLYAPKKMVRFINIGAYTV